jgi:cytochrome d ubiquinol oxidase subunit I
MTLNPLILSRIQWGWVIAWHILMPAFTVGLASYIAVLEGLFFFTGRDHWFRISRFWTRIFAVSFGMGVVSGIVLPFQFGTNWSRFSDITANVISPMLAYEDLMAFFLEAGFLGVLLFGRKLVPAWVHFFAALMVAFGTLFSAFWIITVNSWMQTPSGYQIADGRFFPTNWGEIVFSPSLPYRFAHNTVAFYITTAFVVLGVGAYFIRSARAPAEGRIMMRMALTLLIILVPLQGFLGDQHGLNDEQYQPTKLAAMEGDWNTRDGMPETLFAIPDQKDAKNLWSLDVPHLGSLILTHSWNGRVVGLNAFPRKDWPPVVPVFFAFRIMIGLWAIMLATVVWGLVMLYLRRAFVSALFLRWAQIVAPIGFITVLAGWTVTEVGRQPWTVYGLLRTADSVTPSLSGTDVLVSLLCYGAVYLLMYPTGIAVMVGIVRHGLSEPASGPTPVEGLQSGAVVQGVPTGGH